MIRAIVATPWTVLNDGEMPRAYPAVALSYPLLTWTDITMQNAMDIIPSPNLFVISAIMADEVFVALDADVNYVVLQSEEYIQNGPA